MDIFFQINPSGSRTASPASVRFVLTLRVVGNHFDDPTLTDSAVAALIDHAPQLDAKGIELVDATIDFPDVSPRNAVCLMAGFLRFFREREELTDVLYFVSKLASVADEVEPSHLRVAIASLLPRGSSRWRQKADLLVVANGRHLHLGPPRQIADRKIHAITLLKL
jgi:hypothetical protein